MNLTYEVKNDFYIICIDGDLDASSSILLDNALQAAVDNNEKNILVDCSGLNYISSAGLGVFMSRLKDFEHNSIELVLFELNEKVLSVFKILGLNELIKIAPDRESAQSYCNESSI